MNEWRLYGRQTSLVRDALPSIDKWFTDMPQREKFNNLSRLIINHFCKNFFFKFKKDKVLSPFGWKKSGDERGCQLILCKGTITIKRAITLIPKYIDSFKICVRPFYKKS